MCWDSGGVHTAFCLLGERIYGVIGCRREIMGFSCRDYIRCMLYMYFVAMNFVFLGVWKLFLL